MKLQLDLSRLVVCTSLAADSALGAISSAISDPNLPAATAVAKLISAAESLGLSGNILRAYVIERLAADENIVPQTIERSGGQIGRSLKAAFISDLELLLPLFEKKPTEILPNAPAIIDDYEPTVPRKMSESLAYLYGRIDAAASAEDLANAFIKYYQLYGCGDIATFRAFAWDDERQTLIGIRHYEPLLLSGLIGYQRQKDALTKNTLAFLSDRPANNALLVGDRGTGKSTAIKALANEYSRLGLRLVQVTKNQLKELPKIMKFLRQYASKHFIIYLDDLSFEAGESEYKHIKSAIEGGVEPRPANVLIYATSNRRHLIRETWHDRDELRDDELYQADTVNETVSLSDRFGLIIKFRAPNQDEYLAIIDHALRQEGIILPPEELRIEGHRWEIEHSGRNGRTAKQFAAYYLGQRVGRTKGNDDYSQLT